MILTGLQIYNSQEAMKLLETVEGIPSTESFWIGSNLDLIQAELNKIDRERLKIGKKHDNGKGTILPDNIPAFTNEFTEFLEGLKINLKIKTVKLKNMQGAKIPPAVMKHFRYMFEI